jgi:hypothetical protein
MVRSLCLDGEIDEGARRSRLVWTKTSLGQGPPIGERDAILRLETQERKTSAEWLGSPTRSLRILQEVVNPLNFLRRKARDGEARILNFLEKEMVFQFLAGHEGRGSGGGR